MTPTMEAQRRRPGPPFRRLSIASSSRSTFTLDPPEKLRQRCAGVCGSSRCESRTNSARSFNDPLKKANPHHFQFLHISKIVASGRKHGARIHPERLVWTCLPDGELDGFVSPIIPAPNMYTRLTSSLTSPRAALPAVSPAPALRRFEAVLRASPPHVAPISRSARPKSV
jgi:hypothetical protein